MLFASAETLNEVQNVEAKLSKSSHYYDDFRFLWYSALQSGVLQRQSSHHEGTDNMDMSEWLAQLVGTLIGTGVGFGLATWWDRAKERERRAEDCSETTKSILLELEGVLNRLETAEAELSQVDARGAVVVDMSIPFLPVSAFDAAVHSGRLTLLRPEVQEELSTVY